jgi:molecular chaperone GrpE
MKSKKHNEDEVIADTLDTDVLQRESVQDTAQIEVKEKTGEELAQEYLNDLQRLQADFSNYKKRQQESQKELAGYLIEKLVMEITPVLDNFQMATSHVPAESADSPWVVGIRYIEKQLEKVLADNGMQVIEAKEGDAFDPRIHEAISQEPSFAKVTAGEAINDQPSSAKVMAGEVASQTQVIAKVLQKGYRIGEKVIRPAKVSIK